jgi:GLPGLI family protein
MMKMNNNNRIKKIAQKMNIIKYTILLCCFAIQATAQQVMDAGHIAYERKVNVHKQMEENSDGGPWLEMVKKEMPKYQINNFDLYFNDTCSKYIYSKTQPEVDLTKRQMWGSKGSQEDKEFVYKNLSTHQVFTQSQVFESLVNIKDSLPVVKWKMMNEFKIIAGYNCRKASTIMFDSIYVVAYYTDAISCSSGPKIISGLPGMILQMHIPRLYTTYTAKQVELMAPNQEQILLTTKGKQQTFKEVEAKTIEASSDWGKKWKHRPMWSIKL